MSSIARHLGALWGVSGFVLLIGFAVVRLFEVFEQSLNETWNPLHWGVLVAFVIFMAYSEGYKGFHRSYSPRLAARAFYLAQSGSPIELALAPFYCMSFFRAPKKRIIVSFALTIMIIALVTLFHYIPQPWRGILDAGVVVGLSIGLASTLYFCARIFIFSRAVKTNNPQHS